MADDEFFDDDPADADETRERPRRSRDTRRDREARRAGPPRREPQGIRIIGADEAQRAYEEQREEQAAERSELEGRRTRSEEAAARQRGARRDHVDEPGAGNPPDRPRVGGQVFGEPPSETRGDPDERPSGSVPLPHWTEPPTGEMPSVSGRTEPGGPRARFRDAERDWGEDDMSDLAESGPGIVGSDEPEIDDDEAFAREVEARRRQVREARRSGVAPPSPRGGRAARGAEPDERRPAPSDHLGEGMLEPGAPEPPPLQPSVGERDLPTAVITAVAMAVAALLIFNWGRGPAAWLVALIAVVATAELYAALRARGYRPGVPVGLVAVAGLVLASYDRGFEGFTLILGLAVVTTLVWFLIRSEDARPVVNAGLTLLPVVYVGVFAAFAGLLLAFPNGIGLILGVVIAGVAYDVVGYAVGSRIGTRYIAPSISPNKTLEGLVAGMGAAVIASLVIVRAIHPWDVTSALWLGIVVGVAAPLGDLCESMLKRDIGIKDFGSIIPGHGGVLDRFDAILFSFPAAFYLVRVLELF